MTSLQCLEEVTVLLKNKYTEDAVRGYLNRYHKEFVNNVYADGTICMSAVYVSEIENAILFKKEQEVSKLLYSLVIPVIVSIISSTLVAYIVTVYKLK